MNTMFKTMLNLFFSLTTAVWLLLALICFLFFGAFLMPEAEEFKSINSLPLFQWLKDSPFSATWWLFGSIVLLCLLTANTLLCSFESVIKKRAGKQWLLLISPQIIHIGFLFILLAHLLSSAGSFRGRVVAYEGSVIRLPNDLLLSVKSLSVDIGPKGYPRGWRADIEYLAGGVKLKEDYLGPNRPSFYKGFGIYLKDIKAYPIKASLLEISREPGAVWAFIGGILFMTGTVALVALKIKKGA